MTRSLVLRMMLIAGTIGISAAVFADEMSPAKVDETPAKPSAQTMKEARDAGLKTEIHKGVTVFCWEDAEVGSHFKTKKCVDETRLAELLERRQAQRDQMTRGIGNYGAAK